MAEHLAAHRVLRTADLDRARTEIGAVFCEHRLEAIDGVREHDVRFNSVTGRAVTLSWLDYGGPVRLRPRAFGDFVLVQVPLSGRATVRSGDRELHAAPGIASVPDPDRPSDMTRAAGSSHLLVRLDRADLDRQWSTWTGSSERARLDVALDLRTPAGRAFSESVELFRALVDDPRGAPPPALLDRAERIVVGNLLRAQPRHAAVLFGPAAGSVAPRPIRAAEQFLVAHAREPIGVEEIAAAVGLSPRALQAGFRRHLDTTPTDRLREVRLLGVHRELTAADPTATTVSDVASAWGFAHLGRFATAYRRRFGCAPSVTLRVM